MPSDDQTSSMTRRAAVGTLAAAGVGFAAFGPRGAKERTGGRVVLDYWEKWTGHEARAMTKVVDDFNASQERLYVRYFSMGGIDQKAMVSIAGGDPPDIIGMGNFSIPAYAESNAILPLDEFAAASELGPERYAPAVWRTMTHRGRLWGMVNTCGALALYYNKGLFREAGLDPERPPRTIEELDECQERLTEVGADGRLRRVGFLQTEPDWWSWFWGYYFGGTLYEEGVGGGAGRATAASAENVAAYRWVQGYPERLGVDRVVSFQSGFGFYGTPEHPFLTGKVAMTNQGPWLANVVREFKPGLDYGVAPFPVAAGLYDPERPIGLLDSDVLVIPRGARRPREAFEFIAYTQRREVVEFLSAAHCKNSPLAESSEAFVAGHPNRYVSVHNDVARSERAFLFPRTRVWPEYVAEFDAGIQRIWRAQEPAAAVLGTIERRAQAQLDRAAEQRRRRGGGAWEIGGRAGRQEAGWKPAPQRGMG